MPLQSTFTLETTGARPEHNLVSPGDFLFKTSYTDLGPEVIAFRCDDKDQYGELHIIEGIEAAPADKPLIAMMLDEATFVVKIEEDPAEDEQAELGYIVVSKESVVGWYAVKHTLYAQC